MNLHEYQGKEILKKNGVAIQEGIAVTTLRDAIEAATSLKQQTGTECWVVKAQIHAGGRGKGGGVKVATSMDKLKEKVTDILGMTLVTPQTGPAGKKVNKILIAQDVYTGDAAKRKEFYMSILLDREKKQNVIIYSTEGGMEIEEVAAKTPEKIQKEWVDPKGMLQPFQARKIAFNFGLSGEAFKNMTKFVTNMYSAYINSDAALIEINPQKK